VPSPHRSLTASLTFKKHPILFTSTNQAWISVILRSPRKAVCFVLVLVLLYSRMLVLDSGLCHRQLHLQWLPSNDNL